MLAISDIHGCYEEFIELLKITEYDPRKDQLFLLGDYVDRGKDSRKVIEKIMELVSNGAIALRGNHDDWFLCFLNDPSNVEYYLTQGIGGFNTFISYLGFDNIKSENDINNAVSKIKEKYSSHVKFLLDLPYYYETKDYIFTHAGINPFVLDWKNDMQSLNWIRWDFINNPTNLLTQTVVFGHTTCRTIHNSNDIWVSNDKIGIDGACCFGGQLNCLEITDKELNQYHVVNNNWQGINASPMPRLSVV
ncbi:metallophosphoesterase family protein [Heyndrickxia oleronia]|jgi:serine/threonine protein phosphatase 1|nr:metallophosphoesterase family protein [Heyndrickxia oleronia]MCI1763126.1 serine/threonine protein phosphatase [Heyndrickxia oleronia]